MRHIHPDILALLALGEPVGSPHDRAHLELCDACRAEVENLEHAAVVARSTIDAGELLDPPSRVWSRISDELSLSNDLPADRVRVRVAPVIALSSHRRLGAALAAVAAVVLVLGGVGAAWFALRPIPPTVLARAALEAFPGWSGSTGEAVVEQEPGGSRVIELSLTIPSEVSGYREVWLITSDASELVSLGVVDGTSGTLTVPDGLDLSRYDLVDVSSEPYDGNPEHSGDSILRGKLS